MTVLLRQISQRQQILPMLLAQPQPHRIEGPLRSCSVCACNGHYTDECSQIQEDNTLEVANSYPQRSNFNQSNQGSYQYGGNQGQGWKDNSNQRRQQSSQCHPFQPQQAYHYQPSQSQQAYHQPPQPHH
ncbi:hypothetical protein AHAS_Ahas15G0102600 [Arachis hypogaea]